jgi:hypothetical protein
MQAAAAATADSETRLLAISDAYWDFAFGSPELYQVMHGLGGVPFGHPETPVEAKQTFALVREAIRQWAMSKGVEMPQLDAAVDARWGLVHGLITLTMAGRIAGGPARARQILQETTLDLLFAWSHRPPA